MIIRLRKVNIKKLNMQVKKRKIISVSHEGRKKLATLHACSQATVWNALAYKTFSDLANAIRRDALNVFGGREYEKPVFN